MVHLGPRTLWSADARVVQKMIIALIVFFAVYMLGFMATLALHCGILGGGLPESFGLALVRSAARPSTR